MDEKAREHRNKILVVDDDITVRLAAETMLGDEGFEVYSCDNGKAAIDQLDQLDPDLILLDVEMSVMNGYDTCRAIRKEYNREILPILMMTANDDIEPVHRSYEVGATDFITKPINYSLLTFRIKYLLRNHNNIQIFQNQKASLLSVQRIAKLGYWIWEPSKDELTIDEDTSKLLGLENGNSKKELFSLLELIHSADVEIVKELFQRLKDQNESFSVEYRIIKKNRTERIIFQEAEVHVLEAGRRVSVVGIVQDITERKRAEERMFNLAYYDHLTGLPNRSFMKEHLTMMLENAERNDRCLAVVSLNLNQFSRINDSFGYDFGDELLRRVANRLGVGLRRSDCISHMYPSGSGKEGSNQVDRSDSLARLDSNQFGIVLTEIKKPEVVANICQRVLDIIKKPFEIFNQRIVINCSIGVAVYPKNGDTVEELLGNAEVAANYAKSNEQAGYLFFSQEMNDAVRARLEMENDLRVALKENQFELYYQPKVDIQGQEVAGMEALIRWQHPEKGMIPPFNFIPLAEESELILEIGKWVLRRACLDSLKWRDMGMTELIVSVNVSTKQFSIGDFPAMVAEVLEETHLPPQNLELEITEGTLAQDIDYAVKMVNELKRLGVRISLDDFGTGYSSFSYVKDFPLNTLKIDRSFLIGVPHDNNSVAIVGAIISLCKGLGLHIVAEGVEDTEQLALMSESGCHEIQGFLFSRPLNFDDFLSWVKARDWLKHFKNDSEKGESDEDSSVQHKKVS